MENSEKPIATGKAEFLPALVLQVPILVLSGLILDGGGIAQVCFSAFAAFWAGVAVLFFRRGGALSKVDLLLIRYGYILVCAISYFITRWVWEWRGYGGCL